MMTLRRCQSAEGSNALGNTLCAECHVWQSLLELCFLICCVWRGLLPDEQFRMSEDAAHVPPVKGMLSSWPNTSGWLGVCWVIKIMTVLLASKSLYLTCIEHHNLQV